MSADGWMDDHVVVAHWPPVKPERPVRREPSKRPLTGLPAMMWDLMDAADRHDKLKREAGR